MSGQFPEGFRWGVSTAAHQVEGNNLNSDFWAMEHAPGSIFVEPSGDACDQYRLYRQDIALLAELGFGVYRFSVEWARIEPEPGQFSRAALEHYRDVALACREHDVLPCATLHHFTSPRWLSAEGGWTSSRTPERFARYCEFVAAGIGQDLGMICTINEANVANLQLLGAVPGPGKMRAKDWFRAAARRCGAEDVGNFSPFLFCDAATSIPCLRDAHRRGYDAIKSTGFDGPVGLTLALFDEQILPGGEERRDAHRRECDDIFFEAVSGDDFVGVQTYTRIRIGPEGVESPPPEAKRTLMGYEYYPAAIGATVRRAAEATGCPVYVTENGIATRDDSERIAYYEEALGAVAAAIDDGVDIRGYFAWSLLDNFEWIFGYKPQFGLVAVDRSTQERTVKPSARRLGEIARQNGLQQADR